MVGYAHQKSKETNVHPFFSLNTNCTIWNDEYEEFLNYWYKTLGQVSVQLSIDGVPEVNNHDRCFRFPQNTTQSEQITHVARKHLKWAEKNNIDNNISNAIYVRGSVTKFSLPYAKANYDYIRDVIGFKHVWFMPVHEEEWDDNDVQLLKEQYGLISDRIYNETLERKDLIVYRGFSSYMCKPTKQDRPCGAGHTYCTIDTDGTIYMCHRAQKPEKERSIILGHVDKGIYADVVDKYKDIMTFNCEGITNCGKCVNNNCKYCIAANYEVNGSLTKGFPKYCKLSLAENELRLELRKRLEAVDTIRPLFNPPNNNGDCQNVSQNNNLDRSLNEIGNKIHNNSKILNDLAQHQLTMAQAIEEFNRIIGTLQTSVEELRADIHSHIGK